MHHPELFQQMLLALNSYSAYNGNTTTGSQRIALAKALEALYGSVEGQPKLTIQVDINASVIASQELAAIHAKLKRSYTSQPAEISYGFSSTHFNLDPKYRLIAD